MSQEDLVRAYVDGQVSRRVLVRRLVAAGISLSAALAYAEVNPAQARADGPDCGDHYDHRKKPKKPKKPKKDKNPPW